MNIFFILVFVTCYVKTEFEFVYKNQFSKDLYVEQIILFYFI